MASIKGYRNLVMWQKAHQLVLEVYKITKTFPKEETFGITSQLRRAIVSVAANIVEGYKKRTKQSKINHYNIAEGSLAEADYFILLSKDLEFLEALKFNLFEEKIDEVGKMVELYIYNIEKSKNT
jgi:four helix bundle protein